MSLPSDTHFLVVSGSPRIETTSACAIWSVTARTCSRVTAGPTLRRIPTQAKAMQPHRADAMTRAGFRGRANDNGSIAGRRLGRLAFLQPETRVEPTRRVRLLAGEQVAVDVHGDLDAAVRQRRERSPVGGRHRAQQSDHPRPARAADRRIVDDDLQRAPPR